MMIKLLKADPKWYNKLGGTSVDEVWIVSDKDVDECDGYVTFSREGDEIHIYWQDRDYPFYNMEDATCFLRKIGYCLE